MDFTQNVGSSQFAELLRKALAQRSDSENCEHRLLTSFLSTQRVLKQKEQKDAPPTDGSDN